MNFVTLLILLLIACHQASSELNALNSWMNLLKSSAERIIDKSGASSKCTRDLRTWIGDIVQRKLYAVRMLDANAKVQPGLYNGNIHQLGNYDECLAVYEQKADGNAIKGQYCTVVLVPSANYSNDFSFMLDALKMSDFLGIDRNDKVSDVLKYFRMTFGTCIPDSCSIETLQTIWNYAEFTVKSPVHVVFAEILCSSKDKPVDSYNCDYYVFIFFGTILSLILLSTLYDVLIYQDLTKTENKNNNNILLAFSLYTNGQKLMSTKTDPSNINCVNGIKVISILWIIQGHRFLANAFSPNINGVYIFEWQKHLENTLINASPMGVDSFFTVSGILLAYVYLRYTNKIRKINLTSFYLYRIFRLTPSLVALILFYISIFKYLGDGPAWRAIMQKVSWGCYNTWWATVLQISNMMPIQNQCVEQSWYLSVDTQLYILSPLILFFIRCRPIKVISGMFVTCLLSALYTYIITVQNNYGAVFIEGTHDYYTYVYQPTFIRMPSWLIGIFFGYCIFKTKPNNIHISKALNLSLWVLSLCAMVAIILCHILFTINNYNAYRSAFYNAFVRPIWSLAVGWIIFSCANGYGGFINDFLSLPVFNVLVKLSYCMYLVHIGVLYYLVGTTKTSKYFSNFQNYCDFCSDIVITLACSVVLSLSFELPFLTIGSYVTAERRKQDINNKEGNEGKKVPEQARQYQKYLLWSITKAQRMKRIKNN